jgi:hypothetical protein
MKRKQTHTHTWNETHWIWIDMILHQFYCKRRRFYLPASRLQIFLLYSVIFLASSENKMWIRKDSRFLFPLLSSIRSERHIGALEAVIRRIKTAHFASCIKKNISKRKEDEEEGIKSEWSKMQHKAIKKFFLCSLLTHEKKNLFINIFLPHR